MKNELELRLQILEKFGNSSDRKTLDFCREAYQFVAGDAAKEDASVPLNIAEAIDLGLPSGTKWADRNVGASAPEDTGLYFSWGNTEGHEAGKDYDFEEDYKNTPGYKLKDDIDIEHDAARANMGEPWKMPNKDQFQELVDNCKIETCTLNGYRGRRFTSKINGNSIFMPFAGYIYGTGLDNRGSSGYYWSASLYSSAYGYSLNFNSGGVNPAYGNDRFYGFSVRAVQ